MEERETTSNTKQADEIDFGQLFNLIKKGFRSLFKSFLSGFIYLRKNAWKFLILIVLGGLLGYGLNQVVTKKLKTEVIVKPNLESKSYLYDVVEEIRANIMAKDSAFFMSLGINIDDLEGFDISVEPLGDRQNLEAEMKYLELLQSFENNAAISDIVRAEILDKSSLDHRITFLYKVAGSGQEIARKLVEYVNSNPYYGELVKVYAQNAESRIQKNDSLVKQIDQLIANYSAKLLEEDNATEGRLILDTEQQLNIPELFKLKNTLIKESENKRVELEKRKNAISIVNFGKTQEVQKSLFGKNIVLIPTLLIGFFILLDILKYLNRRAKEMLP